MRRKVLSWLSALLMVAGVLMPAVQGLASHQPGAWSVSSRGPTYENGKTIWEYTVSSTGSPHNLSHLSLAICPGWSNISSSPGFDEQGPDGSLPGRPQVIKWEKGVTNGTVIRVEYHGAWSLGTQTYWVKAGQDIYTASIPGPGCDTVGSGIEVTKLVNTTDDRSTAQPSITLNGGGTAYYFYTITNTGNVPLNLATMEDDKLGSIAFSPMSLLPGQTAYGRATKDFPALAPGSPSVTEVNTFTATATWGDSICGPRSAQASVTNVAPEAHPAIAVTKSVSTSSDPNTGQPSVTLTGGGTVYYFYTVTNTGNVPFDLTAAVDDKLGNLTFSATTLPAGGSATAVASKTFPALAPNSAAQTEVNTVSVTGRYNNLPVGPVTDTATVVNQAPLEELDFTLTKSVGTTNNPATGQPSLSLTQGGTAYYFYTLTNTGNVPLTITAATDDKLGALSFTPTTVPVGGTAKAVANKIFGPLPPGGFEQEINTATVTASGLTREAKATVNNYGPDEAHNFTVTKRVNTVNNAATAQPSVTLTGGGTVYFFYTVTNTGNTTLTLESAEDDKLGSLTFSPTTLAPGESATASTSKTFASPAATETEINIVTVTMAIRGDGLPPKEATATVVNNPGPSWTITKTVGATNNRAAAGKVLNFTGGGTAYYFYTITNTSAVPISVASASDDVLGALTFSPTLIPPGGSATATATKSFLALPAGSSPVSETNTVSASITYDGQTYGPKEDTATVINNATPADVNFTLTKRVSRSNNPASGQASITLTGGGAVYYFYTVTNTGNVPLTITGANDDKLGALSFSPTTVAPGATATATATKTFPALPSGSPIQTEVNVAIVTGMYSDMQLTRTAQASVANQPGPPPPPPDTLDFTITKQVSTASDPATGQASVTLNGGGNVHYFYTFRNTGDVPLTITQAVDDKLGPLAFSPATVAPGGTATATAAKSFVALPAGSAPQTEVNVVQVSAANGGRNVGPKNATAMVVNNPVPSEPNFTITKLVSTQDDPATGRETVTLSGGGTVYYFYTVTNTGNVPITITDAVDDKLGAVTFSPRTLAPGATATARLTKSFAATGATATETNLLTVRATADGQPLGPKTDTATVVNTAEPLGSVEVRVLDGSPRYGGSPTPIAGAQVTLTGGRSGVTDANGRISWANLPFGRYEATGQSGDPRKPAGTDVKNGSGSVTINRADPDGVITIILAWDDPTELLITACESVWVVGGVFTAIGPAGERLSTDRPAADGKYHLMGLTPGTWTVTLTAPGLPDGPVTKAVEVGREGRKELHFDVEGACPLTTGNLSGRICSPPRPGAEITGLGPNGETASALVSSDGRLGQWRNWVLNQLVPGMWQLTLKVPGKPDATQNVQVRLGQTTLVPDFSSACTGSSGIPGSYYLGALLLLAGMALQGWVRLRRA